MFLRSAHFTLESVDGFRRKVPIGVFAGDALVPARDGQQYYCGIYDVEKTMRSGFNTVNGAEEHITNAFRFCVERGIFPRNTTPSDIAFIHMSDPLREGVAQTDYILAKWHRHRRQWHASGVHWRYMKPQEFQAITGENPALLVNLLG